MVSLLPYQLPSYPLKTLILWEHSESTSIIHTIHPVKLSEKEHVSKKSTQSSTNRNAKCKICMFLLMFDQNISFLFLFICDEIDFWHKSPSPRVLHVNGNGLDHSRELRLTHRIRLWQGIVNWKAKKLLMVWRKHRLKKFKVAQIPNVKCWHSWRSTRRCKGHIT